MNCECGLRSGFTTETEWSSRNDSLYTASWRPSNSVQRYLVAGDIFCYMPTSSIIDTSVHQWTLDYGEMAEMMPKKWEKKMWTKDKVVDPVSGHLVPTLPWLHAYWNEDSPEYDRPESGEYMDVEEYRSPGRIEEQLEKRNVDTALLMGHEVMFLPAIYEGDYAASVARAYNKLLKEHWLSDSDMLKGHVLLSLKDPEAAIEEIQRYADDPDMVSALIYGGGELPLGHPYHHGVYEAACEVDMPITIHTSGNPLHRQTGMGRPQKFVTHDVNLANNHMANLASMVYQGVFDKYQNLDVIMAGQGIGWLPHIKWRMTRYYRNMEPEVPYQLSREPHDYIEDNVFVSTYPLTQLPSDHLEKLFDMVGVENIMFSSGYPLWNSDTDEILPAMDDEKRKRVLWKNAEEVYGL